MLFVLATLLTLETSRVVVDVARDPATLELCSADARISFRLERPATVTVETDGGPLTARADGREASPVRDLPLEAGVHTLVVAGGQSLAPTVSMPRPFTLTARDASGDEATVTGVFAGEFRNRPVLQVGRTFISGVDLLDGHLTLQATDIKLEGRHLALTLSRTYSSAGRFFASTEVPGWTMGYATRVTAFESCGLYVVTTMDGSAQTFRSADGGASLTPQKGYHTDLRRNRDGTFDFIDKSGTRHHFASRDPFRTSFHRLDYIEEPHGDRIEVRYLPSGLVESVAEVHRPSPGIKDIVRSLDFGHVRNGDFDQVAWVEAAGLGLRVDYRYDVYGNLVEAARRDAENAGPQVDTYAYSTGDAVDRHQIVTAVHEGKRVDYHYYAAGDPFPAGVGLASPGLLFLGRGEYVRELIDASERSRTRFTFDYSQSGRGVYRTIVDPMSGAAADGYDLNADGSPLEMQTGDKSGRVTHRMEWSPNDILKLKETSNRGFLGLWEYDRRGNLTFSDERTKEGGPTESLRYTYDPTFNKLVFRRGADGQTTRWLLDGQTGDLLRETGSDGKVTQYSYDGEGNLVMAIWPDGRRTTYSRHDNYGNPSVVSGAKGVERRRYDLRGRRLKADGTPEDPASEQ